MVLFLSGSNLDFSLGLRTWLASVGVPTKAKSKKDELIQKALEKLGYTTAPMTVEFEQ